MAPTDTSRRLPNATTRDLSHRGLAGDRPTTEGDAVGQRHHNRLSGWQRVANVILIMTDLANRRRGEEGGRERPPRTLRGACTHTRSSACRDLMTFLTRCPLWEDDALVAAARRENAYFRGALEWQWRARRASGP